MLFRSGRKNYKLFFSLTILVLIFSILQCGCNLLVILTLRFDEHIELLADFYNSSKFTMELATYILSGICLLIEFIFIIFILQLIFLHHWLIKHNFTTYDYVIYLREKKKNPEAKLNILDVRNTYKSNVIKEVNRNPEMIEIEIKEQRSNETNGPIFKTELEIPTSFCQRQIGRAHV